MNTSFYDDKKDGQLITQIHHHEFSDLVSKTFDESIDVDKLLASYFRKEQMLGRKLACLMQLAAQDMAAFLTLPRSEWSILYFRKQGVNEIEAELLKRIP